MRKSSDSISKKRQKLSSKIQIFQDKLKSLQTYKPRPTFSNEADTPALRQQLAAFLRKEIDLLEAEINQLAVGTPRQKRSGWARGISAPELKRRASKSLAGGEIDQWENTQMKVQPEKIL